MPDPKYGVAWAFDMGLYLNGALVATPTIASGDVTVLLDEASPVYISTLPTVSTYNVKTSLSAAEMTASRVALYYVDRTSPKAWDDTSVFVSVDQVLNEDLVHAVWATPVRGVTSVSSPVAVASNYDKDNYTISTVGARGVADEVLSRNVAGGSSGGRTVKQALYVLRNKVDLLGGIVYDTDDSTVAWAFTVASDSSTTRIITVDPA